MLKRPLRLPVSTSCPTLAAWCCLILVALALVACQPPEPPLQKTAAVVMKTASAAAEIATLLKPTATPTALPGQLAKDAVAATPRPTPTPAPTRQISLPEGAIGILSSPELGIKVPVYEAQWQLISVEGQTLGQWQWAPVGAGYHRGTAWPGTPGNCVLSIGQEASSVAAVDDSQNLDRLQDLAVGHTLRVETRNSLGLYTVVETNKLAELGQSLETRRQNALYMAPSEDDRLTLIACWPDWACTHRLIFVAQLVPEN